MRRIFTSLAILATSLIAVPSFAQNAGADAEVSDATNDASTYKKDEIIDKASSFFGKSSSNVGKVVERVFQDQGEPVGYIQGTEVSGAIGFGLRWGEGTLVMKDGTERKIYWQGPSIGFDTGANASKVFTLVYKLRNPDAIYRRYPGVEGSAFFIAGLSATYQKAEGVTLAPIRTGIGFRAGASAGYTSYSSKQRKNPF